MTVQTLLRHLPQFKDGGIVLPLPVMSGAAVEPPPHRPNAVASFARDDAARAAEQAKQAALAEVEAARAECAAARADVARLEAALPEQLAAARADWCRDESDRLAAAFKDATAQLSDRIGDLIGGVLTPFVTEALRRRALDEMTERLSQLMTKGAAGAVVEISGARDLVAALRERLGDTEAVTFRPGDETDLRVVSNDTLMETQLAAWAALLNPNANSN